MLRYAQGNLLDASAEALVNTVNEVGVMGKGIALMFRERFPENARLYVEASKARQVRVGHMLVTPAGELFPRWIIHFPTKKHWRNPSQLTWVRDGLTELVRVVRELGIRSIALPPLGCGNGGLDWHVVRPLIEDAAAQLPEVEVIVYEPVDGYQNVPKNTGVETLTPARALVAELVRRYSVLGLDCTVLEIQKLTWFLQRVIHRLGLPDPLDLRFAADRYGPYADRLRHLLDGLDGSYLHAEMRLGDSGPRTRIWFNEARRPALQAYLSGPDAAPFLPALEQTTALIDGFESPLGMELLATVDWLSAEEGVPLEVGAVRQGLARWPAGAASARRKLGIFDDRLLQLAVDRLQETV